jgi:predicted DNA-binding transcriptional regulator AlpA
MPNNTAAAAFDMSDLGDDYLLTSEQLESALGIAKGGAAKARHFGTGPRFVRVGNRAVRYRLKDVREFIANRTRTSATDLHSAEAA